VEGGQRALTAETARQIRTWRVEEDLSRRAVAQASSDLWGFGFGGNQLHGEDLCAAAHVLGENPYREPWN
jgi:hypothetical protein